MIIILSFPLHNLFLIKFSPSDFEKETKFVVPIKVNKLHLLNNLFSSKSYVNSYLLRFVSSNFHLI